MGYTIKYRKGLHYLHGGQISTTASHGFFKTKAQAKKAFIRITHKQQPMSKFVSNKRILSNVRFVKQHKR